MTIYEVTASAWAPSKGAFITDLLAMVMLPKVESLKVKLFALVMLTRRSFWSQDKTVGVKERFLTNNTPVTVARGGLIIYS
jgi:hypothetical protein